MLRTIRNIFVLLLIGITASGMPIYASGINFSSIIPTIVSKNDAIIVTTEEKVISSNHVQIKYGFSADSDKSYTELLFNENNPFTVELTSNGDTIQDLSLDDLVTLGNYKSVELYSSTPVYIIFDFDQEKLDLPDGSYKLKIKPNIDNVNVATEEAEFDIHFNTEGNYIPALPAITSVKHGETALTLYFPDNEANYLVPITRFVPYTSSPLTTTLRNLEKGPNSNLGLPVGTPIPVGGKAGKSGDTAYVNLPADLGSFNQGSSASTNAVNSLVNSLTSINGISKVQFQFNGKIIKDTFHGMTMDTPYHKPDNTMIYTAYLSDTNRFLLLPIPFSMFGTQYDDNNINTIFDTMKFKGIPKIYNAKRHPIVPNEVELLDYNIANRILTLTFNEEFLKVYENNDHRRQMMVDGIIFTFKSLNDVDFVNIKVKVNSKDTNEQEIINYDFAPPVYINPED